MIMKIDVVVVLQLDYDHLVSLIQWHIMQTVDLRVQELLDLK